eukprot:757699-Hanusia_phi.AAC.9
MTLSFPYLSSHRSACPPLRLASSLPSSHLIPQPPQAARSEAIRSQGLARLQGEERDPPTMQ